MTIDEAGQVLELAAAYDQRTTGPRDVAAWFLALQHLDLDDCQSAIVMHYQRSRERLTPADVVSLIRGSEAERHPSAKALPPVRLSRPEVARHGAELARLAIGAPRKHLDEPLPLPIIRDGTATEHRELVLKHPDLAKRLCEPPLNYTKPHQWNGYIPPETWREVRNDSPARVALLELITEAQAREEQVTAAIRQTLPRKDPT